MRDRTFDPGEELGDADGDEHGLVEDLAPGEAHDGVAVRLQRGVAGAVALKRAPVAVGVPAVGLDDQVVLGPEEVDRVPEDLGPDDRARQPRLAECRQQRALELATGRLGVVVGAASDQLEHERFRPGAVALVGWELRDRLQRGGHAEMLVGRRVQAPGVMNAEALAPSRSAVGERDVDQRRQ